MCAVCDSIRHQRLPLLQAHRCRRHTVLLTLSTEGRNTVNSWSSKDFLPATRVVKGSLLAREAAWSDTQHNVARIAGCDGEAELEDRSIARKRVPKNHVVPGPPRARVVRCDRVVRAQCVVGSRSQVLRAKSQNRISHWLDAKSQQDFTARDFAGDSKDFIEDAESITSKRI